MKKKLGLKDIDWAIMLKIQQHPVIGPIVDDYMLDGDMKKMNRRLKTLDAESVKQCADFGKLIMS